MRKISYLILMLAVLALAALACDTGGTNDQATIEALGQSIVLTATAQAAVTPTARVDTEATVVAAEAAATAQGQQVQETADDSATTEAVAAVATEDAQAYIKDELREYGIDPAQGRLGFIHEDTQIYVEGYMGFDYANQNAGTVAADFVMAADITWNTQYGTTGCGFVVRSDGDQDENFNQYLIIATRGAAGHVLFFTQQEGEINTDLSYDIYANGIDPSIRLAKRYDEPAGRCRPR